MPISSLLGEISLAVEVQLQWWEGETTDQKGHPWRTGLAAVRACWVVGASMAAVAAAAAAAAATQIR